MKKVLQPQGLDYFYTSHQDASYKHHNKHFQAEILVCYLYFPISRGVEIVKFSTCPGTSKWP